MTTCNILKYVWIKYVITIVSDCNDTTVDFYMGCKNITKSGMMLYTCGHNVQSKTKAMD